MSATSPHFERGFVAAALSSSLVLALACGTPTGQPPGATVTPPVDLHWAVVQEFLDSQQSQVVFVQQTLQAPNEIERQRISDEWDARPKPAPALAAATEIVDAGPTHARFLDAAEFLVFHTPPIDVGPLHRLRGARALYGHAADYERWPAVFAALDFYVGADTGIDAFIEQLAAGARDRELRAIARYYLAAGLMRSANDVGEPAEVLEARRQRAIDVATGLSIGLENSDGPSQLRHDHTDPPTRTFAQAEAELLQSIRHTTVGGTLREMTGRRLDGIEERLSSFRGRVVLIDFWATWCGPCINALPDLRRLHAELPTEYFAILAISVDEEVEAVTALRETESMPWANWHAGIAHDLFLQWDMRGFPTYVLADESGIILARTHDLDDQLEALIKSAVVRAEAQAGA